MKFITPLIAVASLTLASLPSCAPTVVGPAVVHPTTTGIRVLPAGYRTVYVAGVPYYYNGSRWYRRVNGRYIITSRPHGYVPARVVIPHKVVPKKRVIVPKKHVIVPKRKVIKR